MTIQTFRTSAPNAPVQATNVVDATAGNEVLTLDLAASTEPNTTITVIKSDGSANTVTIQDTTPTSLGVLESQGDAMTLFCDGVAWSVQSNSSSTDVSTHAALTTAHGSTGAVQGATDVAGTLEAPRITEIHTTGIIDVPVLKFSPGAATPVNFTTLSGSGAGDPIELTTDGTDTDIDFNFVPKGAGVLMEKLVPTAIQASAQADSTAAVLADLVTDFNALLAKLRTGRMLAP